ncbi:carbohydrate-selective porin [Gluconacetobacter sacchari DSM 12717]|uniref:Porin n=2 Tax=Gluconacetobacter sacchari TaxID=92759 RepID=A0A7W4ICR6_9PROT|nr:carbohydrate porin [Gluconacetobacter sacchari]MBB2160465.1 porin [Gluconacetobacter sacchari]GBQ27822.1 carbohydrate-selective porin [Gluconacetobacter sacchari DSM 12717]
MAGAVLLCAGLGPRAPAATTPTPLDPSALEISRRYNNIPAPITFVPSSLPPSVLAGAPLLVSPYTPPRRGPLTFLGHFFRQYGITPHAIFNQYYFTNPNVGPRNGRFGLGTGIALGFDVDLQKMIGLYGGELHFEEILFRPTANAGYPSAPAYAGAVGTYFAGIDMHNDLAGGWLALMTYYQRLLHDRILLSVGRTHPRRYFYFNNCDNALNCTDPIMQAAAGVLPPPYATWGGYFTSRLVDDLSLEAGVFEANLNQYYQGGNGWRWDTRTATGYLLIGGFNFRHLMISHKYGGRYQLMGFFNSSRYTDPYTGTAHNGRAGGEFRLQQMVWRKDHAHPVLQPLPESLHLFGAFGFAADPSSPFKGLAEMGLSYHGLFGRKLDTEQIKFSYARASEHQMLFQRRMRVRGGGDPAMGSQNIMRLELSGHISVMPGIAVEPTIQYIFNPDNYYNPAARTISTNGVVLEAALSVDMGFLTGLSHK